MIFQQDIIRMKFAARRRIPSMNLDIIALFSAITDHLRGQTALFRFAQQLFHLHAAMTPYLNEAALVHPGVGAHFRHMVLFHKAGLYELLGLAAGKVIARRDEGVEP